MAGRHRNTAGQTQRTGVFDLRSYRHPKGYVRVSTDEQAEEGTSVDTQMRQLRAYAAAFGLELSDGDLYVDDGWSGKDMERPAIRQLRADVQAGLVDCVLVTKLDRFSRNLRDTVNLCLGEWQDEAAADRRVILKSISEPFDTHSDFGRMVFGLLAMFAEFERRRISERTWTGKVSRAESGRNAGQRAPYGFRLAAAPDGRASRFEVEPDEAETVRKIVTFYLQGFGCDLIARRLNEAGSRFRNRQLWQSQQVARILRNPLIAGTYAYGRRDGDAGWAATCEQAVAAPIIPPEVFGAVRAQRLKRARGGRGAGSTALLTGILRCAQCGSACGVKWSGAEQYRYYRCLRRKQSGPAACSQPNVRADRLELQVLAAVRALVAASADTLAEYLETSRRARIAGLARSLAELQSEALQISEARQRYFRWIEQGSLRPETVQQRLDELAERLAGVSWRRQQAEAELAAAGHQERSELPEEGWFEAAWASLAPDERKRLIGALIRQISVADRQVRVTWAHDIHMVEFRAGGYL